MTTRTPSRARAGVFVGVATALLLTIGFVSSAAASHVIFEQDFSTDTVDWSAATLTGGGTAEVEQGAFTRFGTYRSVWPGDYIAELDVYLDPAWAVGEGFDYTVASSRSNGNHLRDFIFHIGVTPTNGLRVNSNNNTDFTVNAFILNQADSAEITSAGWYTMQHVFRNDGGVLAVDTNLLDSTGAVVFTRTLSTVTDTIGPTGVVGGNRYGWFPVSTLTLEIDNQKLYLALPQATSKDDCKVGGWMTHTDDQGRAFDNQGDCVSFAATNGKNKANG